MQETLFFGGGRKKPHGNACQKNFGKKTQTYITMPFARKLTFLSQKERKTRLFIRKANFF